MMLLKIDNDRGFFLNSNKEYISIDKITKEDLLRIIELTLTEDVEFDEYDEKILKNQAHQIIYKNIFDKLLDLKSRKQGFQDESDRLFLDAYEKYQKTASKTEPKDEIICSE